RQKAPAAVPRPSSEILCRELRSFLRGGSYQPSGPGQGSRGARFRENQLRLVSDTLHASRRWGRRSPNRGCCSTRQVKRSPPAAYSLRRGLDVHPYSQEKRQNGLPVPFFFIESGSLCDPWSVIIRFRELFELVIPSAARFGDISDQDSLRTNFELYLA